MNKSRFETWILPIMLIASAFYLFVVPALVATDVVKWGPGGFCFAVFLFAQLWVLVAEVAYTSAAEAYGFRRTSLFPCLRPTIERVARPPTSMAPSIAGLISYLVMIYGFGVLYTFVSATQAHSFNCGRLSLFDAVYFSLMTAATVGFGDIYPTSILSRSLVMAEVLVNILYLLFVLSVVGAALQSRRSPRP
jgi:voltage-gated potassium channel